MQKKMIFFDIDGTLLTDEKKVLPSTKEALKQLKKNGHEVAIATGRNLFLARDVIEELDFENYIVCNGAAGYFQHELVYENTLNAAEYQRLIQVADQNRHQLVYQSPELLRRRDAEADFMMSEAMRSIDFGVPEYDRDFYQNNTLYQSLIFYGTDDHALYESGQFPQFRFVRWHDFGVDILPHDGSKANTALKMAQSKGIAVEDTMAFGDGLNDLELLTKVGVGVAMGNAFEEVKLRANKVTKNNNEDGIALALEELNLIDRKSVV